MSHDRLATTTSPKTRLNFLLDDSAPNGRLPDRGRGARGLPQPSSTTRALSADGCIGGGSLGNPTSPIPPSPSGIPPPPRSLGSLDWNPGRQHSNDSLSSSGSIDIYRAHGDDSSESGSASGTSPRIRVLPAPSLLPAAHLLQSSVYGGVLNAYSAPPVHQQQHTQQQRQQPIQHPQQHTHTQHSQQHSQHSHPSQQSHQHQSHQHTHAHQHQHPMVTQPPLPQLPSPQAQSTFPPLAQATLIPPRIVPAPLIGSASITTPMATTQPNSIISNMPLSSPTRAANHNHNHMKHNGHRSAPSTSAAAAARTEQQLRERHDQRKMKNRISAAASRDRKKRSFVTLQMSLQEAESRCQEAQRAIESLKLQLEAARGENTIHIPPDLRHILGGAEYVSQQQLIDVLRRFSNQLT